MSRGPGVIQRIILDTLADGPASSEMLYTECHEHDPRAVRRALGRLWEDDDIRRLPNLAHGMGVWCLPLDERELNEDRELPRWTQWTKAKLGRPPRPRLPRNWIEIDALVFQRVQDTLRKLGIPELDDDGNPILGVDEPDDGEDYRTRVLAYLTAEGMSDAEAEHMYEAMYGGTATGTT